MAKILYIEDEKEIGQWVTEDLTGRGHDVTWLTSGNQLEQYLNNIDLAILDIMLPGLDGFSIGKRIKKSKPGYANSDVIRTLCSGGQTGGVKLCG